MRKATACAAAVLGVMAGCGSTLAAGFAGDAPGPAAEHFATPIGQTLPPLGFVNFCARNPDDCRGSGWRAARAVMSGERWRAVYQVNSYVNGSIAPMSDDALYGQAEYWAYPNGAGDCEDYVLMKKRYLERLGFDRSALLITVVLDERNEGHAVLTLRTEDGDFVLDNRRNEIRRWRDLDYVYLKRQSERDPHKWVALEKGRPDDSRVLAAGTD